MADEGEALFENAFIRIERDAIVAKCYYFPVGTSKRIRFSTITKIEAGSTLDLGIAEMKTWGMAMTPAFGTAVGPAFQVWWPLDSKRSFREYYMILRLTSWPACGITMPAEDHERALRVLQKAFDAYLHSVGKQAMVTTTTTDGGGGSSGGAGGASA